jgi:hypothetical protein
MFLLTVYSVHDKCEFSLKLKPERLNREVVQGFVDLVQELVHRPAENK